MTTLDWLEDYLRDAAVTNMVRDLLDPQEDDEEVEEMFLKNMVLNAGADDI
jgi:hypothetical protein